MVLQALPCPSWVPPKKAVSIPHFGYIFGAKTPEENSSTVPASLKTVAITEETTIGYHAFYGCNELTNITVADSVTEISLGAFSGCYRLTNMTLPFVGAAKDSRENTHFGYIFGAKTPETNNSAVPSLKTVVITGETSIGDQAFYLCSGIKSITPPHTLTSLAPGHFKAAYALRALPYLRRDRDRFQGHSTVVQVLKASRFPTA